MQDVFIFADEFQNLALRKNSALTQIFLEGRKFNLSLIVATQALGMTFSDSAQKRMLQAGTMLYFRPIHNEIRKIASLISPMCTSDWVQILDSLAVGECVAVGEFLVNSKEIHKPLRLKI